MQGEYRVLLLATLITTTRELPVKLRSLSPTGATVEGFNLPAEGADVILQRGALDAFATVVQSEGRRCLLRFETALTDEDIRTQIRQPRLAPQVATVEGSDHRRPGFRGGGLTDEEQQAVTEWARPVGRLAYRD
jgi:hypothetical protein